MNFRRRKPGGAAILGTCALLITLTWAGNAAADEPVDSTAARPKVYSSVTVSYTSTDPAPSITDPWAPDSTTAPNVTVPGASDPDSGTSNRRFTPRFWRQRFAQRQAAPAYGRQYVQGQPTLAPPQDGTLPEPAMEVVPGRAQYDAQYGGGPGSGVMDGGAMSGGAMSGGAMSGYGGPYDADGSDGAYGPDDGGGCCDGCNCCGHDSNWLWENLAVFGGVQGFKGPPDNGFNGNFGFHEGLNWAVPIIDCWGLGYQLGGEVVESDFFGGGLDDSTRVQEFVTTGLFRRAICGNGLQGGVVLDYLHDGWTSTNLIQLRPEVGWLFNCTHEVGFWGTVGLNSHSVSSSQTIVNPSITSVDWRANNWYALYYRRQFCNTGTARLWAGFTNEGEALVGVDASTPLTRTVNLEAAFNYAIPKSDYPAGAREESFGLTVNLVWNLGFKCPCSSGNPYRPLFGVADNTTFLIDQSTKNR